ncbi:MAG: GxxExxY protein [Bacteroidaceae bacterium]|nr:GxxExxY protein [Bacteroidaceae bacterium]
MVSKEKIEQLNKLSETIIGAAIEVHKYLGPGLLETVYEICLVEELEQRGLNVQQQVRLPLYYKGQLTNKYFVIDLLIENEVILELKAVDKVLPVYENQLMTYLKLTQKNLGLLINFNVPRLIDGIRRRLNG